MTAASRGAALRACLLALAALRIAALALPSMALWGLNSGRFASPVAAWALTLLPCIVLIPAVGRALDRAIERAAEHGPRSGLARAGLVFIAAGALVLVWPDRIWFVGDYLLREGAMREPGGFLRMFPQAQPLDVLLHHTLPQWILRRGVDTTLAARALDAAEAGILALLARRFARGCGLTGAAAFAVGSVVFAGGYLSLFAGYSKPTIEVGLLAVAIGVYGVELIRSGRGALAIAIAFAMALALHRSAISLLPGIAGYAWFAWRGRTLQRHRTEAGLAALALGATLVWFLPRLWHLFGAFDLATNFTSFEVREQGGPLAAAVSGLRLLDLGNLILLHVPLVLTLPATLSARAPSGSEPEAEHRARAGLAIQCAGHLPAVLFTYVTQGAFRDWDAHTGAFASLALLVALLLARGLAPPEGARRTGLASAVAIAAFAATLTLLTAQNDLHRGLQRARAFLDEPPRRTLSQRLATLDFLGLRNLRLERFGDATDAFAELAAQAPHPRALVLEGTSAILAGRDSLGLSAFSRLVARDSTQAVGWFGVWLAAGRTGDTTLAKLAEARVLAYPDSGPQMGRILGHLQHYPGLWEKMPRGRFSGGSR